ncbi:hypothetical protein [uncultured Roseivirga sp.]|uniref:hypothetical protein n=1 Tax=uncultured Roseivirga sp. TaxID=543088 RepID=UPI0030DC1274|tara:strand:+ start:5250 stop:5678 length:429 start_codon:yes stop_codon:yes gene_type:complete
MNQQDLYSASALKPMELIEELILTDSVSRFEIDIVNVHNGRYQLTTEIEKEGGYLRITNHEITMNNVKSDTVFIIEQKKFSAILTEKIKLADKGVVFAGNYQDIEVKNNGKSVMFHTRKGHELIGLLREGKSYGVRLNKEEK